MSKGSSSPPPPTPPDYNAIIDRQTAANRQAMLDSASLNRIGQNTPYGSLGYTQVGVDENGIPQYQANVTLNPQDQAILDELRRQTGASQHQSGQRQQMAGDFLNTIGAPNRLDLSQTHPIYDRYAPNHQWTGPNWQAYGDPMSKPTGMQPPNPQGDPMAMRQNPAMRSPMLGAMSAPSAMGPQDVGGFPAPLAPDNATPLPKPGLTPSQPLPPQGTGQGVGDPRTQLKMQMLAALLRKQ